MNKRSLLSYIFSPLVTSIFFFFSIKSLLLNNWGILVSSSVYIVEQFVYVDTQKIITSIVLINTS